MTEYAWSDLRDRAIRRYGQAPHGELEAEIIEAFERHPQIVDQAIDRIADRYDQGLIQKPWAVLRKDVTEATTAKHVTATDTTDRDRAIQRAEQWIRAAGIHYDRADEITDELFGDQGRLRQWNTDQQLHDRMLKLWATERPRGQAVETEREQWYEQRRKHLGTDSETIPF